MKRDTSYLSVFSPNAGKYGPEKTPYLDTFHAVIYAEDFSFKNNPMEMKISSVEESFFNKEIAKLNEKVVIRKPLHKEGEVMFCSKAPWLFHANSKFKEAKWVFVLRAI